VRYVICTVGVTSSSLVITEDFGMGPALMHNLQFVNIILPLIFGL